MRIFFDFELNLGSIFVICQFHKTRGFVIFSNVALSVNSVLLSADQGKS